MQLSYASDINTIARGVVPLWSFPVSDKRNCYVYVLYREDGVTPFYVGKGQGERWADHEKQAHRKHTYKNHVILGILAKGMSVPRRKVAENLTSQEACDLEVLLIAQYGRYPDGILTNRTAGGEGLIDPSPEVCEAISRANTGRPGRPWTEEQRAAARLRTVSEETRIKISLAHKGKKGVSRIRPPEEIVRYVATRRANGSYTWTEEQRQRMSALLSGRTLTEQQKAERLEKMGGHGPNFGKKFSEDTKSKIAAALTGNTNAAGTKRPDNTERLREMNKTPAHREKLRVAMTGRVMTDEHIANLTEANRRTGAARRGRQISDEHRANLKLAWEARREREIAQGKHQPKPPVDVSRSESQKRRWEAYRKAKADGQSQESADA